nr:non-canonical poly(A) RNA polymerase PAPD5 [Ipomoea batatas]GME17379.1 non-canonical poly(A) RNA polymerase PAPD5 [Ipomoea batatas]
MQVKSAFSMAFTTLTNANAILELGPSRSILGMIIRPDEVLLVRKGGSDGDTTFDSLLPGAGEPLPHSDMQDIYYNWQLNDEDEELLPRGNGIVEDMTPPSSSKKRKKSKEKQSSKKKMKDDGHSSSRSRKEKSSKKRRWKHEGSSPHYVK